LGTQVDFDAGLVAGLREDDPDAAVRLVERYGERVYRLAARITGTRDDAEDAAQSALTTAVRTIDELRSDSSLGAWIDRLAAHAAYRKLLARSGSPKETALDDVLPPLDGAGRHFEPMSDWSGRVGAWDAQGELRQTVTDAVDALPPDCRVSLVLHDVEGMSSADIAEVLGIGPSAVRARLHHARLFLRKRLSDHFESA
jgi:RNA polymerase sigma-70 factor, ECF subfamily